MGRLNSRVLIAALLLVLTAGAIIVARSLRAAPPSITAARTVDVQRGVVVATVSATGSAASPTQVNLNFKGSTRLVAINVKPSQRVTRGQVLAREDDTDVRNALAQQQAALESARARLAQLEQGLSPEEQDQAQVAVEQAQMSINSARIALDDARAATAQDAVNLQTAVDQASAQLTNDQNQLAADQGQLGSDQNQLLADQAQLDADQRQLDQDQQDQQAQSCPPNATTPPCNQINSRVQSDQTKVSQDKQVVSSDRSKVDSDNAKLNADQSKLLSDRNAIQNVQNAQAAGEIKDKQSLDSAHNSVNAAELSLRSTLAANAVKGQPPKQGDLAASQAAVVQAETQLETAQRAVDETSLVAPVDGTVASVGGQVGEFPSAGGGSGSTGSTTGSTTTSGGFIVLTDVQGLQVSAAFNETDAANVAVNQPATVAFDALPDVKVPGHVISVDPVATVVSNVVTYNVTFALDRSNDRLKPGMTANASVVVAQKENVLHAANLALRSTRTGTQVTKLVSGKQVTVDVTVGLRGDTDSEITNGVSEGDLLAIATSTTASTPQPTGGGGGGGPGGGGVLGPGGGGGGGR